MQKKLLFDIIGSLFKVNFFNEKISKEICRKYRESSEVPYYLVDRGLVSLSDFLFVGLQREIDRKIMKNVMELIKK